MNTYPRPPSGSLPSSLSGIRPDPRTNKVVHKKYMSNRDNYYTPVKLVAASPNDDLLRTPVKLVETREDNIFFSGPENV